MLEAILTRIILRFANRYIGDSFHTDTFSLWGGDLVVQNFELRTEELIRAFGGAGGDGDAGLRLVRGFVRELRVHVPWKAIRSESLSVEVDAVEIIFASKRTSSPADADTPAAAPPPPTPPSTPTPTPVATAAPVGPTQSESLDEASETWLQPLLQTVFGNAVVAASNVVAKVVRNNAVGCLTVSSLHSRPHSQDWEAGFTLVTGPRPLLHRVAAVRDITVSLDQVQPRERRAAFGTPRRTHRPAKSWGRANSRLGAGLPVLHRASIEVLIQWPALPWLGPVTPLPTSYIDAHVSPLRARLTSEQLRLLANLLRPEAALHRPAHSSPAGPGGDSHEAGLQGRARPAALSDSTVAGGASAPSPCTSPASSTASPLDVTHKTPPTTLPRALYPLPDVEEQSGTSFDGDEEEVAGGTSAAPEQAEPPPRRGFLRGFLADVLWGDDEEEEEEEEGEAKTEGAAGVAPPPVRQEPPPRRGHPDSRQETRRAFCLSACVPLIALSLEHQREVEHLRDPVLLPSLLGAASPSTPLGRGEVGAWVCTLSLIGISAFAVSPPRGEGLPMEGAAELHHVSLQGPGEGGAAASSIIAWGSPLGRSPLEADEVVPASEGSLGRARAWAAAARRILAPGVEFPHPSHCTLANSPVEPGAAASCPAAVRIGLLAMPQPPRDPLAEPGLPEPAAASASGHSVRRVSMQVAELAVHLEAAWVAALRDTLRPLAVLASSSPVPPHHGAPSAPAAAAAAATPRDSQVSSPGADSAVPSGPALEAVVCAAGLRVYLQPLALELGSSRLEYRTRDHSLGNAQLAAALRETTVFISSALAHVPGVLPATPSGVAPGPGRSLAYAQIATLTLRFEPPMPVVPRSCAARQADPGARAPTCMVSITGLRATSGAQGPASKHSVQCQAVRALLAEGRHSVEVSQPSVTVLQGPSPPGDAGNTAEGLLDITASVDGAASVKAVLGRVPQDIGRLVDAIKSRLPGAEAQPPAPHAPLPPASAPTPTLAPAVPDTTPASAAAPEGKPGQLVKWRLLVNHFSATVWPGALDARCLTVQVATFSIFSWPAVLIRAPGDGLGASGILRKRLDLSVEAFSASAGLGQGAPPSPLFSPFGVNGSVTSLEPAQSCGAVRARARTEVDLRFSQLWVTAGAWQLRLVSDAATLRDPSLPSSPPPQPPPATAATAPSASECDLAIAAPPPATEAAADAEGQRMVTWERLTVELGLPGGASRVEEAGESADAAGGPGAWAGVPIQLLSGVLPLDELEPWQAVRLPDEAGDGGPRYAIRLDRPARVRLLAARLPGAPAAAATAAVPASAGSVASSPGASADEQGGSALVEEEEAFPPGFVPLLPQTDFGVEAWDDVLRCFVDVANAGEEEAVCSHLIALRLPALAGLPACRLLASLAAPIPSPATSSELALSIAVPRLTWSVLHSAPCCHSAPLQAASAGSPCLEEPFGQLSFVDFRVGLWQGGVEGMKLLVGSQGVGIEMYDVTTLSLVQVALPGENSAYFTLSSPAGAPAPPPSSLPLLPSARRRHEPLACTRSAMDLSLGHWRAAAPPWAMARLAHLGTSIASAWSFDPAAWPSEASLHPSSRMPVIVRNALPVPVLFGQLCVGEALGVAPGEQRAYVWNRADPATRSLTFALHADGARSPPVHLRDLPADGSALWALMLLPLHGIRQQGQAGSAYTVHVCARQVSRAQCTVTILPPVLLYSRLSWAVEFLATQDSGPALFGTNGFLTAPEFLEGLPAKQAFPSATPPLPRAHHAASLGGGRPDAAASVLQPGRFIGVLAAAGPPSWIQFRRPARPWGLQLPLSVGPAEPYATLLPVAAGEAEAAAHNVMCTCQDLWVVASTSAPRAPLPRRSGPDTPTAASAAASMALRPPHEAALPNVVQLTPLLRFTCRCPFPALLAVPPLGLLTAGPGQSLVLEAAADPRQVKAVELRVPASLRASASAERRLLEGSEELLTSGPLMLNGLTQFPHLRGDETVSWRNSVRCCAPGCEAAALSQEAHFLVELRRCKLSSVLRSIAVEPMWSFFNETGEDIYVAATAGGAAKHVATAGESACASLGEAQHDPSFPFVAAFGVRRPETLHGVDAGVDDVAWSEGCVRCPMGQVTRVEVACGQQCFVFLVCVGHRHRTPDGDTEGGRTGGGVHICLYPAAYARSGFGIPVEVAPGGASWSPGSPAPLRLPALPEGAAGSPPPAVPWPWWPAAEAAVLRDLFVSPPDEFSPARPSATADGGAAPSFAGSAAAAPSAALTSPRGLPLRLRLVPEDGVAGLPSDMSEVSLELPNDNTVAAAASAAAAGGREVAGPSEFLAPPSAVRACGGVVRDVCFELRRGPQCTVLVNLAYHVHARGCFVLAVVPTRQPPLLLVSHLSYPIWVEEPGLTPPRWRRVPPGSEAQLPCPALRTLEVFSPGPSNDTGSISDNEEQEEDGPEKREQPSAANQAAPKAPRDVVQVRLSVQPEADEEEGGEHLDLVLTLDSDVVWQPPLGLPAVSAAVRYVSGVSRVELRPEGAGGADEGRGPAAPEIAAALPAPLPRAGGSLPVGLDLAIQVADLVLHVSPGVPTDAMANRSLTLHGSGLAVRLQMEREESHVPLGRAPTSRMRLGVQTELLSLADVGRPAPGAALKQVAAVPALDVRLSILHPPYGLPATFEEAHLKLLEDSGPIVVCIDDGALALAQVLGAEVGAEFEIENRRPGPGAGAGQPELAPPAQPPVPSEEFRYLCFSELRVSPLPLSVDLQLAAPVFLSFTGLSLTFPEVRFSEVVSTSTMLGQELLAHCIAFLLLNSPMMLGSCDLLGNPMQAYRHLKSGLNDLLNRPLSEGVVSFAQHLSSASLASLSAVAESVRRNLPAGGAGPSDSSLGASPGEGLAAGARALAEGLGRGLGAVVRWDPPSREQDGPLGLLHTARRAATDAVAHPVGGLLDFVTATARGWTAPDASVSPPGPHPASCPACMAGWPLRPAPDASPAKFHLQRWPAPPPVAGGPAHAPPAPLLWVPRCELLLPGASAAEEPALAALLLDASRLWLHVHRAEPAGAGGAGGLRSAAVELAAVQLSQEVPGRRTSAALVSATSAAWRLRAPGEVAAHLQRARRLAEPPPGLHG